MNECISFLGTALTSQYAIFLLKILAVGFSIGIGLLLSLYVIIWLDWRYDFLPSKPSE